MYIFFSSQNYSLLEIKKFNYTIYKDTSKFKAYFQLCQGKDFKNELIIYISNKYESIYPKIFGKYNISFIDTNNIKNLSDLDFNNIKENKLNLDSIGYLKISCEEPTMIKYDYYSNENNFNNLFSGEKLTISFDDIEKNSYTLDKSLVNETIPLKFKVFGLNNNESIKLNLSENLYELKNGESLEINYLYKNYLVNLFNFIADDETIKNKTKIEIIIGFLKKDLDNYSQIDFDKTLEELNIKKGKGVIIKVPKNFSNDLLDYSLISDIDLKRIEIEIAYDKLEYIVPSVLKNNNYMYSSIIPLFKLNPYTMISENKTDTNDKYFCFLIYNERYDEINLLLKKPKIFSEIKFNELNILPQLINENKNYYYQINISKIDYNYLSAQIINYNNSLNSIEASLYHNSFYNPVYLNNAKINIISLDKSYQYLNIYDTKNINYINIAPSIESIHNDYSIDESMKLDLKIEQIKDTNKLKIKMNSLSYYLYLQFKYYLIINLDESYYSNIAEIISGHKKFDENTNQEIIIIEEDNIKNEIFEKEVEIKKILNSGNNSIIIVPVKQENNMVFFNFLEKYEFNYINYEDNKGQGSKERNEGSYLTIILITVGIISLIIIIAIIIVCLKKKNNISSESIESNVLNEKLNKLQEE